MLFYDILSTRRRFLEVLRTFFFTGLNVWNLWPCSLFIVIVTTITATICVEVKGREKWNKPVRKSAVETNYGIKGFLLTPFPWHITRLKTGQILYRMLFLRALLFTIYDTEINLYLRWSLEQIMAFGPIERLHSISYAHTLMLRINLWREMNERKTVKGEKLNGFIQKSQLKINLILNSRIESITVCTTIKYTNDNFKKNERILKSKILKHVV